MPDSTISAEAPTEFIASAIVRLSPRWTTWTLQTVQQHGPMRLGDINSALPWVGIQAMARVVRRLEASYLLERPQHGIYGLSPLGGNAQHALRALAAWHHVQFTDQRPVLADAERTEDALRRLSGKGTIAVLEALEQHGPLPSSELGATAGLATGSLHHRVQQLQTDGLITRTSPFSGRGAEYALTPAAQALTPVYAELATLARDSESAPSPSGVERRTTAHSAADTARATAAVRRSPALTPGMFSHAPVPQTRVPMNLTELSRPSRTR
ncbi:winged helix-turn-helix transcriptional regulator [Streptomyces sp. NPDC048278]|uniref:winged helix-turn-helix transcriptional regulator n=1 Tax=Streptomyces sp. NPDC048278 TaxID=3155809 RepID=UPI0034393044